MACAVNNHVIPAEDQEDETATGGLDSNEAARSMLVDALAECAERALLLLCAEGVAIAAREGASIVCRAGAGEFTPETGVSVDTDAGLTGECVRTRQLIVCRDTTNDPRVNQDVATAGIGAVLLAPVIRQSEVLGVVEAFWRAPHLFNDTDLRAMELVARQVSRALQDSVPRPNLPHTTAAEHATAVPHMTETARSFPSFLNTAGAERRAPRRVLVTCGVLLAAATGGLLIAHQRSRVPVPAPVSETSETNQRHLELIRQQAEQGNVGAQSILALFYWTGRGVKQDNESAYMWSAIAAAGGDENSKERLDLLRASMSPEMISRAEQRTAQWMREHPQSAAR